MWGGGGLGLALPRASLAATRSAVGCQARWRKLDLCTASGASSSLRLLASQKASPPAGAQRGGMRRRAHSLGRACSCRPASTARLPARMPMPACWPIHRSVLTPKEGLASTWGARNLTVRLLLTVAKPHSQQLSAGAPRRCAWDSCTSNLDCIRQPSFVSAERFALQLPANPSCVSFGGAAGGAAPRQGAHPPLHRKWPATHPTGRPRSPAGTHMPAPACGTVCPLGQQDPVRPGCMQI
jgi:hypothetical protein